MCSGRPLARSDKGGTLLGGCNLLGSCFVHSTARSSRVLQPRWSSTNSLNHTLIRYIFRLKHLHPSPALSRVFASFPSHSSRCSHSPSVPAKPYTKHTPFSTMKLASTLLASFVLSLALFVSAKPYSRSHSRPAPSAPSIPSKPSHPRIVPRHADDDCDLTQTYTATYTSDSAHTYTILSVSTNAATYTSLRTSTRSRPSPSPRTVTATKTRTAFETQTITDYAPTATITVTAFRTQTETDVGTQTLVSTYTNTVAASAPSAAPAGECNTGPIQCCDQVAPANSTQMSSIISAIGIGLDVLGGLGDSLVATSCSPIDVLSLGGGAECNQSPVCCNNNDYQGLINIGCVPIQL